MYKAARRAQPKQSEVIMKMRTFTLQELEACGINSSNVHQFQSGENYEKLKSFKVVKKESHNRVIFKVVGPSTSKRGYIGGHYEKPFLTFRGAKKHAEKLNKKYNV